MSRFWSPVVHRLTPYVPGEQPKLTNLIKLNTNESPYGPPPGALEAIRAAADDTLRLYSDPTSERLRAAIAQAHDVGMDEIFVGNGSDEVLAHAFHALLQHDAPLLTPDITYSFYPVYCGLYGIAHQPVPLDDAMRIDVDDYRRPCAGLVLPNPNAPTGIALGLGQIETLLRAQPDRVVVIDEAYVDFGADTAIPLVRRFPNLLVVRTLSKSHALAGLRVGYAIGHPDLVEALNRVKDSFNSYPLDRLAQAGAAAAIADREWLARTTGKIIKTRIGLTSSLRGLGFEVLPSQANFVFARHPDRDAAHLAAALRERAIIVRHFRTPRIAEWLRITVGTDEECRVLTDALGTILTRNAD
ncbi:histidinol-phosphate transaminase [Gluconacetobacter diazotrophicus]|uniref:Histidinol-phosphate aminotransferase n=1 Tax=Gluconacetobacter diazotrophicus (strain ATCC 49037 / DSM 5601 / CCUG 37298 / CIP 103539 / LMG 7603 / PAl5) TaxID=272568 RepID=HIS8_GLUDA|nr:histidinol-phosphate transaminase [Gluconacetobacter diazotrophicus]A9H311.1 RecName: Full=Histidinol-phosphate aminotransferase; AltName: Full=Imidazole acetol-phosphate transaminase [Gluconacetobacter diazotrophicus PA1 5]CAP54225.1 Histidinol-phosphate aminotransferase [Gluconacetobacter diazotrophicus PA1 5]